MLAAFAKIPEYELKLLTFTTRSGAPRACDFSHNLIKILIRFFQESHYVSVDFIPDIC